MELSKALRHGVVGVGIALLAGQGQEALGQMSPMSPANPLHPANPLNPANPISPFSPWRASKPVSPTPAEEREKRLAKWGAPKPVNPTPAKELEKHLTKVSEELGSIRDLYARILRDNPAPRGFVTPEAVQRRLGEYTKAHQDLSLKQFMDPTSLDAERGKNLYEHVTSFRDQLELYKRFPKLLESAERIVVRHKASNDPSVWTKVAALERQIDQSRKDYGRGQLVLIEFRTQELENHIQSLEPRWRRYVAWGAAAGVAATAVTAAAAAVSRRKSGVGDPIG